MTELLDVRPDIVDACRRGRPTVALESTLIAHGLPYPANVNTARSSEEAVIRSGAVPATIAILNGVPTIGLSREEIDRMAQETTVLKASRRDLAFVIATRKTAATTVSATMALANMAGIRVFATGGIGGVHKLDSGRTWDVSADLIELARTPVAVVCAGAKNLLDLPNTLEYLETLGVPVVGFGCDEFPAFYVATCGVKLSARVDDSQSAARLMAAHWQLGGNGVVIAQPPPSDLAIPPTEFEGWLTEAERQAAAANVSGPAVTPFVLARLAELSNGRTVELNQALITANAKLAGGIAVALSQLNLQQR